LSEEREQKIKLSVALTGRVVNALTAEAKILGISFPDMLRRALDDWMTHRNDRSAVRVLDRENGTIRVAR
jgi:hypothetical protein